MAKPQKTNVDTLKAAGIINPRRKFTNEQISAIESLSPKQIDQLISVKEALEEAGTKQKPVVIIRPGVIGPKPPSKPGKPKP